MKKSYRLARPGCLIEGPCKGIPGIRPSVAVFWDDKHISLLPGEKREVTVYLRKADLAGAQPTLLVDGFNVTAAAAHEPLK